MADQTNGSNSSPDLSEEAKHMMTDYELYTVQTGRRYSGDGTWTEGRVLCTLVDGPNEDVALSKAGAALANRDGRPDPLFAHSKTDTFDLAVELESLPLAIAETPWADRAPIARLSTDEADAMIDQIRADCDFEVGESIVFDEWGTPITSEADLQSEIKSLGPDGWVIVGVGLKPTGAGEGNEEFIGNTYEIHCPDCNALAQAECVNIVYNDIDDSHQGVWSCNNCGSDFRGVHPKGPAGMQRDSDSH